MGEYQRLEVWHKSMQLVSKSYLLINNLPSEEKYCLGNQMRNCAVSIPSNIAEGQARNSIKEFIHHLSFSGGSVAELETQLLICELLGYFKKEEISSIINELHLIDAMLNKLIKALKKKL